MAIEIKMRAAITTEQYGRFPGDRSVVRQQATFFIDNIRFDSEVPFDDEHASRINHQLDTLVNYEQLAQRGG